MSEAVNVIVGMGLPPLHCVATITLLYMQACSLSMAVQFEIASHSLTQRLVETHFFAIGDNLGDVEVTGSSATATVLAGNGTTLSYHGSSSGTIAAGNCNDTVIASAGNDTIALGAGENAIQLGTGNSTVYSSGTDSIVGGSAYDEINISGANTSDFGGYGTSGHTAPPCS